MKTNPFNLVLIGFSTAKREILLITISEPLENPSSPTQL